MEDHHQWQILTDYVNDKFPQWKYKFPQWEDEFPQQKHHSKSMPRTYVTPPIYRYENKHVPSPGTSISNSECHDYKKLDTDSVEEHVINIFVRYGDYTNQPMFLFPNFEFEKLAEAIKRLIDNNILQLCLEPQELKPSSYRKEVDLIIVHREHGIILVEVKSNINDYQKAQEQLDETERRLYDEHLSRYFQLNFQYKVCLIKKVIACPCQNESEIKKRWKKPGYINLCKNHIDTYENFQQWWFNNMSMITNIAASLYDTHNKFKAVRISYSKYLESVYSELVPKLLCNPKIQHSSTSGKVLTHNRDFMHIIDRKTIQEVLLNQSSLEELQQKRRSQASLEIKKGESEIKKAKSETEKAESKIQEAESQSPILTSLIQAAKEYNENAKSYIDQVELRIQNAKALITPRIISTDETSTLHKFGWKHMTPEQSEVWSKKKQIICGPYGSGKTVLIQCKAADLALYGENVLIILPFHLLMEYKKFFEKYAPSVIVQERHEPIEDINKMQKIIHDGAQLMASQSQVEDGCIITLESHGSNTELKINEEKIKYEEGKYKKQNTIIFLVSLNMFYENYEEYEPLVRSTHVFIDELLWSYFVDLDKNPFLIEGNTGRRNIYLSKNKIESSSVFLELVKSLLKENTEKYLWISPHLYIIIEYLLTDKKEDAYNNIKHFYEIFSDHDIPITTLSTTMRTTKQIHDFMVQKEWQDFVKFVDVCRISDVKLNQMLHCKIFRLVLCNGHGHHTSGPPVRIFNYNFPRFDGFDKPNFENFSSMIIISEVTRFLESSKKNKINNIAIIIDAYSINAFRLKDYFQDQLKQSSFKTCTLEEKEPDAIVICISLDIASFEWPMTIHIKDDYHYNSELEVRDKFKMSQITFFEGHNHMIASRCTQEYIIISRGNPEYELFWPQRKSLQSFTMWCEENQKNLDAESFEEYRTL